MHKYIFAILLVLGAAAAVRAETGSSPAGDSLTVWAPITVEVAGLRNGRGDVKMALFQTQFGFPDKSEKAFRRLIVKIPEKGKVLGEFADVPPGEYGLGVIHDENQNGRVDANFFGLPTEGVGFSNNAMGRFGPPPFEDARFKHGLEKQKLTIRMVYLL